MSINIRIYLYIYNRVYNNIYTCFVYVFMYFHYTAITLDITFKGSIDKIMLQVTINMKFEYNT